MKTLLAPIAAALITLAAPAPAQAAGTVELTWVAPEKFADIGRGIVDREHVLKSMGDYIRGLGAALPDGQTLKLEVLDLDLAGEIKPFVSPSNPDLRVLRGRADWPRMKVRYTLSGADGTIKSGEADLADMGYLEGGLPLDLRYGDLGYEKRMVEHWFKQNFVAH